MFAERQRREIKTLSFTTWSTRPADQHRGRALYAVGHLGGAFFARACTTGYPDRARRRGYLLPGRQRQTHCVTEAGRAVQGRRALVADPEQPGRAKQPENYEQIMAGYRQHLSRQSVSQGRRASWDNGEQPEDLKAFLAKRHLADSGG